MWLSKSTKLLLIVGILLLSFPIANAQRKTEIGLTGGAARFYPITENLGASLNDRMDNGWGWSTGIFIEEYWKSKIHQVVELNYYGFKSDVFLEKIPDGGGYGSGQQPIYGNYDNTSFSQIAVSGGVKYLMNNRLFLYPAFEIGYALNPDIDVSKTVFSLKLGLGVDISFMDLVVEYDYGLNTPRMVLDPTVPFAATYRNSYLQLKAQFPLYNLRK